MKAAFIDRPGCLYIREVPDPQCRDHEVLVNVKEIGICGSDLHYYREGRIGDHVITEPHILGHECAGIVVETGRDVQHLKTGDRVTIEPGVPCMSCSACLKGRYNLCDAIRFVGAPPYHGAFREYLAHDARFVFRLPESLSFDQGAMVEPLAVAYHATAMLGLPPGSTVFITGAGPIGFSCLEMALARGAGSVILSEPLAHRREVARNMGASLTIDPGTQNVVETVRKFTAGRLCDCALEASGSESGAFSAVQAVKRGGSVAFIGMGGERMVLPHAEILKKELAVRGIYRYANAYPPVLRLLASGRIRALDWISHRLPLSRIQEAMEMSLDERVEKLKIMITTGEGAA